MKLLKEELAESGPKDAVSSVTAKVGGVVGANAPGQLPRGETQVSNVKRALKFSGRDGDELYVMMQQSKAGDDFVRDIKTTPDPAIILANDRQFDDLVRFCATPAGTESSILTVDPTFSLGDFECTPTTYRHLLLTTRRSAISPVFVGPTLIHYRKNFSSFLFFAASLIAHRRRLEGLRCFGTDGEKALIDAFSHEFRFSVHLYCHIHLRGNIKNELHRRNFPDSVACEIANDILGKQVGSTYCEGLVDAESETMFYQKLEEMKRKWSTKEDDNPSCTTGFYEWFCEHKLEPIVAGMLRPVREEAGLGMPPVPFTTNASESLNAMLKRKVHFKKNELPTFVNHLKQLVEEQERELERCIIGRGKYQFRKEFRHLEIKESDWFRMSRDQRERHLKKVAQVNLISASTDATLRECEFEAQLPISPEEFHCGLKIPLESVRGIWKKASELLSDSTAISSAPGFGPECKMVASRKGKCPHLVTKSTGGKFSCDKECPNWRSIGLCSHCVAVAHTNGNLEEFCNSYRKSKRVPSISQLLLTGLPSGIGNKGNRVSKKRKREEVINRVPLATPTSISLLSTSTTASSQLMPSQSYLYSEPGPSGLQSALPQTPTQWRAPGLATSAYGTSPTFFSPQSTSTSDKFEFCFRTGNISVCHGCKNRFDKQARPPLDLCIRHSEWRSFTSPVSHQLEARFGNAYYHTNPLCISARWPTFCPHATQIGEEVLNQLLPVHKEFIATYFGITL